MGVGWVRERAGLALAVSALLGCGGGAEGTEAHAAGRGGSPAAGGSRKASDSPAVAESKAGARSRAQAPNAADEVASPPAPKSEDDCPRGTVWVPPQRGPAGREPGYCSVLQALGEPEAPRSPFGEDELVRTESPPVSATPYVQSDPGDPEALGCADGQREGFADVVTYPLIAGCRADWSGAKSLRDPPTGTACGDDAGECPVPADACAKGWHVCASNGSPADLADRIDARACELAGPGRFNAAISHSLNEEMFPCPPMDLSTEHPCLAAGLGAEPVCCGEDCLFAKCKDGVWKGKTRVSRGTAEGCGAQTSKRNGAVLCCADPAATSSGPSR